MQHDKLSKANVATKRAVDERESANKLAGRSIEIMLKALSMALDGKNMMGLPNLGSSFLPYRGVRVRAKRADEPITRPKNGGSGRESLCVSIKGELESVKWTEDGSLSVRTATRSELNRADLPEDVAEAILSAVDFHLEGCDKAFERYSKLKAVSQRLEKALEGM